ncbi:MAG: Sec-independent protein translocase subunit TatA/TatB, partial [Planctomycetota bacterium]|jgi:sec-independent protein translocase protein TatA
MPLAFALGPAEIFLIILVILLLFGTTRLPKLGRSIGKTIVEFKSGMAEARSLDSSGAEKKAIEEKPAPENKSEEASEKSEASGS